MKTELINRIDKITDEQNELFEKLFKLDNFLQLPRTNESISDKQYELLWAQRSAMKIYLDILHLRVDEISDRINNL